MDGTRLGFTVAMETDDTADTTEGTVLQATEHREDQLIMVGGVEVVRVRALTGLGSQQVRAELQLLASLEVDGVAAAPEVLEVEDGGYLREAGSVLSRRRGRRCSEGSAPGAAERQMLARARDDLDALISALHARGWVLGGIPGEGLAVRKDGSVAVQGLTGLKQDCSSSAQVDDRLWVDSVLQDQDRTLRRRIDDRGVSRRNTVPPSRTQGRSDLELGLELDRPEQDHRGQDDRAQEETPQGRAVRPLPAPRALNRRRGQGPTRVLPGGGAGRRDILATTGAVVLAGVLLGAVAWSIMPRTVGPDPSAASAPASAPVPTATQAADPAPTMDAPGSAISSGPGIEDPLGLATELAQARHAYLTGSSDTAITLVGSSVRAQDDSVRAAYEGIVVTGGEPVVHSAQVLEESSAEGTARLSVQISSAAHTTVGPDGTTRQVPASPRTTIHLDLRWDGESWYVEAASPA